MKKLSHRVIEPLNFRKTFASRNGQECGMNFIRSIDIHQSSMPAVAFFDCDDAIAVDVFESVHLPTRPAQRHLIHSCVTAKAKMQPGIILRNVASATSHFVNLAMGACSNFNARP